MAKMFEALEEVRREKGKPGKPRLDVFPFHGPRSEDYCALDAEQEMVTLYRNVDAVMDGTARKVIQFIGAQKGDGVSTVVRDFALVCASRLGKSVLLLDADSDAPTQHLLFRIDPESVQEAVLEDRESFEKALIRIGDSNLFVCVHPSLQSSKFFHRFLYSHAIRDFWNDLRDTFDLILVDSPPASTSPDGIRIARFVDGVILVVEAGKTRQPVARHLKNQVEGNGGNIVGVVLNKQRRHIPGFIYRRL